MGLEKTYFLDIMAISQWTETRTIPYCYMYFMVHITIDSTAYSRTDINIKKEILNGDIAHCGRAQTCVSSDKCLCFSPFKVTRRSR